jgi:hypothetical protein
VESKRWLVQPLVRVLQRRKSLELERTKQELLVLLLQVQLLALVPSSLEPTIHNHIHCSLQVLRTKQELRTKRVQVLQVHTIQVQVLQELLPM